MKAGSGKEALEIVRENSMGIDPLFTDIIMPEMSGPEVAKRIRAACPNLPVLFASGYPADHLAKAGLSPKQVALIRNPFRTADLAKAVRSVLDDA